ncbi:MAG: protein TonB [Flavobacteriaceae bacterium]|jgi:protein TonB
MELKKSKDANIERVRTPIILLGLLFSGSLVLAGFTFTSIAEDDGNNGGDDKVSQINYQQEEQEQPDEEIIEPEQVDVPPPIQEEVKIEENKVEPPKPDVKRDPPPIPPGPKKTVVVSTEIIDFPDVEAGFPGGPAAMKLWIQQNVVYPDMAMQMGDQGKVYLEFIIEPDGSITGVKVKRGVTDELDREAKRVVRKMPKWKPGEAKGKSVRTRCRLPITFTIG